MSSSKTSWILNSYDAHREPCKIELTSWCGWWAHKAPLSYKEIMTFNIGWAWGAGLRTLTPMEYIQMLTTCWEGGYSFDSGATTCKFPMILWKWPLNYVPTSDHKQLHWILKFNMGRNISLLYFFYCWCPLWSEQISAYLSMRIPSNCGLKREGHVHITVQGQ